VYIINIAIASKALTFTPGHKRGARKLLAHHPAMRDAAGKVGGLIESAALTLR
jgi:hypothetical protein